MDKRYDYDENVKEIEDKREIYLDITRQEKLTLPTSEYLDSELLNIIHQGDFNRLSQIFPENNLRLEDEDIFNQTEFKNEGEYVMDFEKRIIPI